MPRMNLFICQYYIRKFKSVGLRLVYWHVDKKSTCIYSQLKTCTSSEVVAAMIKGVLYHLTDMDMQQGYVDTHSKSTVGFGICSLMHFDLLPRFKSIAR